MQVKDIMATAVVDVGPEASLHYAIQLMLAQKVSGLPVVDRKGQLVGVLSEGDILRRTKLGTSLQPRAISRGFSRAVDAIAYTTSHSRCVRDVMSAAPVTTTADASLEAAVELMEQHGIKRLPVVDQNGLVGIISRADFLHALARVLAPARERAEIADSDIKRNILTELQEQNWARDLNVAIIVNKGAVELHGTIFSESQRAAIRILAENVNGVRSVAEKLVCRDPATSVTA
jgi:CBS-domain-containing membrane protein